MKRIILACILLATCSLTTIQRSAAQTHISAAAFTTQVNLLDSLIGTGNTTAMQTQWGTVHSMMLTILNYTKYSIMNATTPADKASYESISFNQRTIYAAVWALKPDLITNRSPIYTKLGQFDLTIY